MTPLLRITFQHASLPGGSAVVKNPDGWQTSVISLTRHEVYHSLVEEFKGNFLWFGDALEIVKAIEASDGINAVIGVLFDLSYKAGIYVNLFTGQLKAIQLEEIIIADRTAYKLIAPIIRNDFWSKFIGRSDTSVDLEGVLDVDGAARTPINKIVLPMPSQKIRASGEYQQSIPNLIGTLYDYTFADPDPQFDMDNGHFAQVDFDVPVLDEAKTKHILLTAPTGTTLPVNIFTALYDGVYTIESKLTFMRSFNLSIPSSVAPNDPTDLLRDTEAGGTRLIRAYIKKNNEDPIEFTIADTEVFIFTKISGFTEYTFNETFTLKAGDTITLYLESFGNWFYQNNGAFRSFEQLYMLGRDTEEIQLSGGGFGGWTNGGDKVDLVSFQANYNTESYLKITADTTYPDTETDAFLIKDAAESIISKLVGQDAVVKSDFLDACAGQNAIFRGKHLRGFSFATKKLFMTWEEWWKGAAPLLFLGLGYTEVAGVKKIEIENRAAFFDNVPVVNISNVAKLSRKYALDKIYKSIETRYKKGLGSESDSGIDDPQTSREFSTVLSQGVKDVILCEWLAASLAIERSRRNRVEGNKDDRNDEDIMVVALVPDGDDWLPEFGTVFTAITNLLNSDFRINVRHSATRLFKRAQAWYNGCMIYAADGLFTFARGEGNYEMTSELDGADCEYNVDNEPIQEGGDINSTDNVIFIPRVYEATEVPLSFATYQLIVANRKKALGVSRTATGHVPMHIIDLDYDIYRSRANMVLLQATTANLE